MDCANGYIMTDEAWEIGRFPAMFYECNQWDYEKAAFRLTSDKVPPFCLASLVGWLRWLKVPVFFGS
jgi:hypothetical protein